MGLRAGALVLLSQLVWLATAKMPCEDTGLCSLGKTRPYVGEIFTSTGLKAALAARSYQKEVVLLCSTHHPHFLVQSHMAINQFMRHGMEHVMILGMGESDCKKISEKFPRMGCVWSNFTLPIRGKDSADVVSFAQLWHTRFRLIARAVRLGYNILSTDTDIILFNDPYKYWKSEPFVNHTLLGHAEAVYHQDEYYTMNRTNGGIFYVQNAAPNGPTAWVLAEVVDRLLRWIDDEFESVTMQGVSTACNYVDQEALVDALTDAIVGRPLFWNSYTRCIRDEDLKANPQKFAELAGNVSQAYLDANPWRNDNLTLPAWMAPVAGGNTTVLRWASMRVPHAQGSRAPELGANLYPAARGPLSNLWLQQLKDDCSSCPLWPDPDDAAAQAASDALPRERFAFMPPWLALGWYARGRLGYWDKGMAPGGVVQQVFGHEHIIPGTDSRLSKPLVKQALGVYDWGLAHLHLGQDVFAASREHKRFDRIPRLLAFHPSLKLGMTRTFTELLVLVQALAQLAFVSGRTVVWPSLPCSASWVSEPGAAGGPAGADQFPLHVRKDWTPYTRNGTRMCIWHFYQHLECMTRMRGMFEPEFEHFKDFYSMWFPDMEPSESNTVFMPDSAVLEEHAQHGDPGHVHHLVQLNSSEARAHLQRYSNYPVLYAAYPIRLHMDNDTLKEKFEKHWSGCLLMSRLGMKEVLGDLIDGTCYHVTQGRMSAGGQLEAVDGGFTHKHTGCNLLPLEPHLAANISTSAEDDARAENSQNEKEMVEEGPRAYYFDEDAFEESIFEQDSLEAAAEEESKLEEAEGAAATSATTATAGQATAATRHKSRSRRSGARHLLRASHGNNL